MRKIVLLSIILFLMNACASMEPPKRSMVDDLGSPEKAELLRKRVGEFWTAFVKEDYEKIYYLYDPLFQVRANKYAFMGMLGKIKYHEFEIKDIKVEGNVARVKVWVVTLVPEFRFKQLKFSQPEKPVEFEETWLYIYDNWYKEYYMEMMEQGLRYY